MINSHVHSKYSPDSTQEISDVCEIALAKGLKGVAITDHVAFWMHENGFDPTKLIACKKDILNLRKKYDGKLKILFGMEVSEYHFNPSYEKIALDVGDFDVVLCSLHDAVYISNREIKTHFTENNFTTFTKSEIIELVKNYYSILKYSSKFSDYDVLAHLTYPLRYITLRDKVEFDYEIIREDIIEILKTAILRNKAIELNTSKVDANFFSPNEEILRTYKDLGGELITLGSDAHVLDNIDKGLIKGKELLKKCGFTKYYYYEKRKPKIAETL